MEIGEYRTNVVSTDDFALVRYMYLECHQPNRKPDLTTLLQIVDSWSQLGILVVEDNDGSGIWVFGNVKRTGALLPNAVLPDQDGLIRLHGITLKIKEDETYTYDLSKSLQASKQIAAALKEAGNSPIASTTTDNPSSLNAKAAQSNAATNAGTPPITSPHPIKIEHPQIAQRRKLKDRLTAAIIAALSYRLCNDAGYIALNARTLLLPTANKWGKDEQLTPAENNPEFEPYLSLLTLDINLTAMGSVVLKASLACSLYLSGLSPFDEISLSKTFNVGQSVLLAPIGKVGKYLGNKLQQAPAGDTLSNTDHMKRVRTQEHLVWSQPSDDWKRVCLQWLAYKGVRTKGLGSRRWLKLQMQIFPQERLYSVDEISRGTEKRNIIIFWPAALCFLLSGPKIDVDAQILSEAPGNYDPLEFAQEWYTTRNDREATISKRKKEREAAEATAKTQADIEARGIPAVSYSPVALRRASAGGMVYPTPPDAVQPTVGATPSFDGNVSTPGQPNHHAAAADIDNSIAAKGEAVNESKSWDTSVVKPDPAMVELEFNDNGNENLFGDMGDDLFGENDITDADFSFFDEPDAFQEGQVDLKMDEAPQEDSKDSHNAEDAIHRVESDNQNVTEGTDIEMSNADINPENKQAELKTGELVDDSSEPMVSTTLATMDHPPPDSADQVSMESVNPPLSPEVVFKRLSVFESLREVTRPAAPSGAKAPILQPVGAFQSVDFDPTLFSFDKKYGLRGRFNSPLWNSTIAISKSPELPKTDYLRRRQQNRPTSQQFLTQALFSPTDKSTLNSPPGSSQSDFEGATASNMASPSSIRDDTSDTSDENAGAYTIGSKRKRADEADEEDNDDDRDQMASSFQDLSVDHESTNQQLESTEMIEPNLLNPDLGQWSLARFLQAPSLQPIPNILTDEEYIAAAQLLSDQATSRTLKAPGILNEESSASSDDRPELDGTLEFAHQSLMQACKYYFEAVTPCTLTGFLEIPGASILSQARLPPRPPGLPRNPLGPHPMGSNALFTLPPPHLQVRRGDSKLTVLPPAILFWDSLGLAPSGDSKDVTALCIYPEGLGMADNAEAFLEQMRSAYESGRLGLHDRFSDGSITGGLVSLDLSKAKPRLSLDRGLTTIKETAGRVGTILASSLIKDKNFVVYCVYDPNKPELLLYICSAFHHLLETYKDALSEKKQEPLNEIILQLVPMDYLASQTSLIIPSPSEYARLALEVYDRCIQMESGEFTPSIVLEQPLPRNIDFKLTPNPSESLLHENSCMHVAYAQSIDDRWVTAAWTDNSGRQQMTTSYCLGRKETPLTRNFSDVAHEIWETTLEVISSRKVHWRVFIVKCGAMNVHEMDFWKGLAATESNAKISLTLLMVDTQPSLQLLPPPTTLPPTNLSAQSTFYSTPVSTPQSSSVISPEQSGNVTTPVREGGAGLVGNSSSTPSSNPTTSDPSAELKIEPDATLVDVSDETWGAILGHRNNNSNSLLEFVATLMSGYLIKRGGSMPSDVPLVMEVNILHSDLNALNAKVYEALLREILLYYRGLATLARARGAVDPVRDTRPWHIAAAEKGVRALYILM